MRGRYADSEEPCAPHHHVRDEACVLATPTVRSPAPPTMISRDEPCVLATPTVRNRVPPTTIPKATSSLCLPAT